MFREMIGFYMGANEMNPLQWMVLGCLYAFLIWAEMQYLGIEKFGWRELAKGMGIIMGD